MKVYLSGPIKGIEDFEQRFLDAEIRMKAAGYETLNPCSIVPPDDCGCVPDDSAGQGSDHSWACWVKHDLIAMLQQCDGLAYLHGHQNSRGARLEIDVAERLGMQVAPLARWLKGDL